MQDGPGNRLVYHLQGCNMRCPWCANPEGLSPEGVLMVDAKYLRASACPRGAVRNKALDRSRCAACRTRACVARNRTRGIRLSCFEMTPAALAGEAAKARHLFHDGGGVTFTGGDPLVQYDETRRALLLLKGKGISTALETNAFDRRLPDLMGLVDFLIIDLKHHDSGLQRAAVGAGNETVLSNLRKASSAHPHLLVRITLVPGFNAARRDAARFADLLLSLGGKKFPVELIPYHEYGRVKWGQCGLEYRMKKAIPGGKAADYFRGYFRKSGLNVIST